MPVLTIPVQKIMRSGLPPEIYMAMRLEAAGAPVKYERGKINRTGKIIQQDDKERKNIIFSWEE